MTQIRITRALLSVSDKTGIVELARALAAQGTELLSTGGTARALKEAGLQVIEISDYTGFPEMMDGRVKTLVPQVHGGLLALRDDKEHLAAMKEHGIRPIDMVIVNLYPFEETRARGAAPEEIIENIDIGGPSMLRSAAKNHRFVTVVTDPADYATVLDELKTCKGATTLALRQCLAAKAYARTASYDAAIAAWFAEEQKEPFPERLTFSGTRRQPLRYGENPHQRAAFYVTGERIPGVATAKQLQGKELSFNNIHDTDAAFELAAEFDRPAAVIVKHANPCGVAVAENLAEAYARALQSDPVSAFGGILAFNRALDAETAAQVAELFAEVIIAPEITAEARALLASKENLRLLETRGLKGAGSGLPDRARAGYAIKTVAGGFLMQERDARPVTAAQLETVTKKTPTDAQQADLLFAFVVCKHLKSNAIVIAREGATVGLGGGQTSRVDAVRQAVWQANHVLEAEKQAAGKGKAGGNATSSPPSYAVTDGYYRRSGGAVLASDAFFPFPDNIALAAEAGISAIIQPGGSRRDAEVIAAADRAGIAMVFTGQRHFRH